jgi:sulfate transport system ATP-binding protein
MSILVKNISKRFGDFVALDDVSLDVESGALTALLGPSGSGKSTLLRIIAGLETPDQGEILLAGKDATVLAPQKRNVGFVFQHYAAFKHMTVWDNVAFGLKVRKRPKAEIAERVDELLNLVQLQNFGHRYPAQLSGGQRQRMGLARALAPEPQVLLLDEPFGALDARVRSELREWLRQLHDVVHVTTVFVTHDQDEAMEISDEIAVINHGSLEQVGSPRQLYDEPASEFVMTFVGDAQPLGESLVRPHDIDLLTEPAEGAVEAMIVRITLLGRDAKVGGRDPRAHDPRPLRGVRLLARPDGLGAAGARARLHGVRRARLVLGGSLEEVVVAPGARDSEIARSEADQREAVLLEDTPRRDVVDERCRLETMEAELPKRELGQPVHCSGREPAAVPRLLDPVPEIRALNRTANEIRERNHAGDVVIVDDRVRVFGGFDSTPLAFGAEELLGVLGLERREEASIRRQEPRELSCVVRDERPDHRERSNSAATPWPTPTQSVARP